MVWGNNLTGSLPPALGRNGRLKTLDVTGNHLTGTIPPDLCAGRNLQLLVLMDNAFFGSIPDSLGDCKTLTRVRLGKNLLTGPVPPGLFDLPQANMLELTDNMLTGELPDVIAGDKIGMLMLGNNGIGGRIPAAIGNLPALQTLSLESNNFLGPLPPEIGRLRNLTRLNASGNALAGGIPRELMGCGSLGAIDLSRNGLTGEIPDTVTSLKILCTLNVSRNRLSGELPPAMSNMTSLTTLDVSYNQLWGPVPMQGQFLVFNESSFVGNPGLCGAPFTGGACSPSAGGARSPFTLRRRDSKKLLVWLFVLILLVLAILGARKAQGIFAMMRTILCLNRNLPYGTTGPDMDFFEAAFEGDLPRLREMASGKDAEEKALLADVCFEGLGPLQVAARMGRLDVVRYLVEDLGFDVNHGSAGFGLTALSSAALDGRLDTVRYLLDNGADPNLQDELGEVPLHCAAKYGHDKVTELLLSRGASVDLTYFHATPLHIAAVYGKASVMKILLEHHADPNMVSEVLGTPLVATLHATTEGLEECISLKCVKVLVEAGADVNSTDPDTPLVVATTHGLTDCIKYLLKAGANANIPNSCCGAMPIETAASCGRRKHVEMLFPFTSPIQTVSTRTVDGIISHVKSSKHLKHSKPKVGPYDESSKVKLKLDGDKAAGRKNYPATSKLYGEAEQYDKSMKDELKLNGDKAVGRKDYLTASKLYGKAIELDPADATLYSNRSLCLLQIGEATEALSDAKTCIKMRPEWIKGYYRKGTALMSLKEYKEACNVFMAGFKLDPSNAVMERMFWEAAEAMKKDHVGTKDLESID